MMMQLEKLADSAEIAAKCGRVFQKRTGTAGQRFCDRVRAAWKGNPAGAAAIADPPEIWKRLLDYNVDFVQRSVLFWDTLRQRGNAYLEHERAGKPPVLHFQYETVQDARTFERPVNYALLRIIPPPGVTVDPRRRPYVIIDPRAGHGPGIGGFKDDSQVGVALRAGHPVYFVVFFPEPVEGQTLLDVCQAEGIFLRKVRGLHPDSPKPAIVGNCQGGWAAMMAAASNPEHAGPIVLNGAPMSYWGGAWSEGAGDNPMRYAGGLLGGSWLASLASDLGNGKFDGAHLVQNFENLNPANTFWDKYYNLFAQIDREPPRFLEFERWWGGFFLMNRQEIEWIVRNLFVGNRVWTDGAAGAGGKAFDLRGIRSPIVLFASLGDNITPPQQAFNWVADIYGSTDEIKANGQTIVGLVHEDAGHLGIFVSGRVAKKEHAQIVSVLKSIEALPPGLWAMRISEQRKDGGTSEYAVDFEERTLEDVVARLNRFERRDEQPFRAAASVSDFNQRLYEIFVRPFVQAGSNELTADVGRRFHPLRFTRWAMSDLNAGLWWLPHAAGWAQSHRSPVDDDHPLRRNEKLFSELVSATFDYYRDIRDALSESAFFQLYGNLFLLNPDAPGPNEPATQKRSDPRDLSVVQGALEGIEQGGFAEAVARAAYMLRRRGDVMPFARLKVLDEVRADLKDLLPNVPADAWRRLLGEQEIIVRYEPEMAFTTLPKLLAAPGDRQRFLTLLERLAADERIGVDAATAEQKQALARIRAALHAEEWSGHGASKHAQRPAARGHA